MSLVILEYVSDSAKLVFLHREIMRAKTQDRLTVMAKRQLGQYRQIPLATKILYLVLGQVLSIRTCDANELQSADVLHCTDALFTVDAVGIKVDQVLACGNSSGTQTMRLHATRHQIEGEQVTQRCNTVTISAQARVFDAAV